MAIAYTGPNAELVAAVIEVAGPGFKPATTPNASLVNVEFTTDLEQAVESCFDQEYEPLIGVSPGGYEMLKASPDDFKDGILWQDICSNMVAAEIWTAECYVWSREQGDDVHALRRISDSWKSIADRLCETAGVTDRNYAESIGEDIAAILSFVAQGRAFRGTDPVFYELLFHYCRLGFWPCGFIGTWPDDGRYLLWHGK